MSARQLRDDPHFFEFVGLNPALKVVLDARTGFVFEADTNRERARRKLPVPWTRALLAVEIHQPPVL